MEEAFSEEVLAAQVVEVLEAQAVVVLATEEEGQEETHPEGALDHRCRPDCEAKR